jgi:uncharacterized protein YjeT (DUF2065 family)
VIMFALVELPIIAYLINPERAGKLVDDLSDWAHRHSRTIGIAAASAVGLWLLIEGVFNLVS